MSETTNKLTVCLIKPEYRSFDEIIESGTTSIEIDGIGTFYGENSFPRQPSWVRDFFGSSIQGKFNVLTASSKGVLLIRVEQDGDESIFAILFGHGRHLLQNGVIEERFGLKVALNTVDPNLRSIDKIVLGSIPKHSREQISRTTSINNFGIDIEQDLLSAVTGRSNEPRLGKTISGKDALSVWVKVDATEIIAFLRICLERYKANDYKDNGFEWIDQIKDIQALDSLLVDRLVNKALGPDP